MTAQLTRQDRVVLAIALMALALPLILGAVFIGRTHAAAAGRIAQIEPRHARLLGLEASRAQLAQAEAEARMLMAQIAYPETQQASQAGNDAQQRIRSTFAAAKLDVLSSQVLAAKREQNLERIPLTVRAEGELPALQAALLNLSGQSPAILIESINIQSNGFVRIDASRLTVQVQFYVLRSRS